jgi:hypothetical protein
MNNKQKLEDLKKQIAEIEDEIGQEEATTLPDIMRKLKEIEKKIDSQPVVIPCPVYPAPLPPWRPTIYGPVKHICWDTNNW